MITSTKKPKPKQSTQKHSLTFDTGAAEAVVPQQRWTVSRLWQSHWQSVPCLGRVPAPWEQAGDTSSFKAGWALGPSCGNSPLPGVAVGCCEQHPGSAVPAVQPCCASRAAVLADVVPREWSGCSAATPRPRWVTAGAVLSAAGSCTFLFHCLWFYVETFQFTKLP